MSYAIIRVEKYKRGNMNLLYRHDERRNKNYSNKHIDPEKSYLNYRLKETSHTYEKEFDRLRKENNLKGQIKEVSNIVCEYMITSDNEFFRSIGEEETKRYFQEAYNFVCKYKELGEENIISAVIHLDEETPHMHLVFIPVVHTTDKSNNPINKVACSEFWKAKDSYRQLQDSFHSYIISKGFQLERGQPSERKNLSVAEFKKVTNYDKLKQNIEKQVHDNKEVLQQEKTKLENIPKIKFNRDESIQEKIITPLENQNAFLIHQNQTMQNEIIKLSNILEMAENTEKENKRLKKENFKLCKENNKLNDKVSYLHRIINTLENTIEKFITWVCSRFSIPIDVTIRNFEKDNNTYLEPEKQIEKEDYEYKQDAIEELEW